MQLPCVALGLSATADPCYLQVVGMCSKYLELVVKSPVEIISALVGLNRRNINNREATLYYKVVGLNCLHDSPDLFSTECLLWSPYGIGQTIIFSCCGLFFFFLSFFPRLISAAADWMSAILPHMVWP